MPITLEAFRHLFQLREAIETYAVREAIRTFTPEQLAAAEELLQTEQQANERRDLEQRDTLEEQFHQLFIEHLDNPHLTRIAQNISDHRRRLRHALASFRPDYGAPTIARHRALLAAIRAKDEARAEQLVAEAIQSSLGWLEAAERAGVLAADETAPKPTAI